MTTLFLGSSARAVAPFANPCSAVPEIPVPRHPRRASPHRALALDVFGLPGDPGSGLTVGKMLQQNDRSKEQKPSNCAKTWPLMFDFCPPCLHCTLFMSAELPICTPLQLTRIGVTKLDDAEVSSTTQDLSEVFTLFKRIHKCCCPSSRDLTNQLLTEQLVVKQPCWWSG